MAEELSEEVEDKREYIISPPMFKDEFEYAEDEV